MRPKVGGLKSVYKTPKQLNQLEGQHVPHHITTEESAQGNLEQEHINSAVAFSGLLSDEEESQFSASYYYVMPQGVRQ